MLTALKNIFPKKIVFCPNISAYLKQKKDNFSLFYFIEEYERKGIEKPRPECFVPENT